MTAPYRPGYEVAAERILELIRERGFVPGDRLPTEQALALELGFSRSVTREAVKVLAALGRVSAHRGRGLYVSDSGATISATMSAAGPFMPSDPEDVEQLLRFRQIQEVAAARNAALSATPPDLRVIRDAVQAGQRALTNGDQPAWDAADEAFHVGIAAAARNKFLWAAVVSARELQRQVVVLALRGGTGGTLADAQAEHVKIYDAISGGDPELAGTCAELHLTHTLTGYRQAISDVLAQDKLS